MGGRHPGPLCSTRVGDDWIDGGTSCRTRSQSGVLGKTEFDSGHVYSLAPEAARKRDLDLEIVDEDYSRGAEVSLDNEPYLKKLIELGSKGKKKVKGHARDLQFFIIHGGGEGFLRPDAVVSDYAKRNAADVERPGRTTSGHAATFHYDENDVLAVFDSGGTLISAALLRRPIEIPADKGFLWSRKTAEAVYSAWDNKTVSIYKNTHFVRLGGIPYLGFAVDDGFRPHVSVDIHKKEATNGCIFIVDPKTPGMDERDASGTRLLDAFEPKLIVDVLAAKGMKPENVTKAIRLGTMQVVDIK